MCNIVIIKKKWVKEQLDKNKCLKKLINVSYGYCLYVKVGVYFFELLMTKIRKINNKQNKDF